MSGAFAAVYAVLESAPGLLHALPSRVLRVLREGEKDPEAALEALDEVAFAARRSRIRPELSSSLEAAGKELRRDERTFVRHFPRVGPLPLDVAVVRVDAKEAGARAEDVSVVLVPAPAPAGTVVALERRGRRRDREVTKALLHVASGVPRTGRLEVLEAVLVALEAAKPAPEDHERLLRAIDGIERDDPRANSEAAVRFALSCIERAHAIPKAREVVLAFLAAAGITPIALAAGERFEPERHSADAFERRFVRGPKGRVVATELTGFRDERGVVLSRAVILVGD